MQAVYGASAALQAAQSRPIPLIYCIMGGVQSSLRCHDTWPRFAEN
jgi:hypothetical protein